MCIEAEQENLAPYGASFWEELTSQGFMTVMIPGNHFLARENAKQVGYLVDYSTVT